ncbi:hypothetical protein PK69_15755 [Xanthomonas phaseoli pv. phaseoli]|nr:MULTISPECIES: XopA/Hpa1 family type III secretion system protein [Xanthomonas]ATS23584.1 hypothetical protein XppCFBP412P_21025 [Xanthomonas phaseoli pv. phaseoli]ATS26475.1 hypothetical protein XppCFBP6164P_13900 [Xanthomonas phaseoli pv. phaseoli]ATS32194.1 hypothetical protein XppCFBP6546P_09720 [Xanthomonas phaseoli pv. phaseoli]ATS34737.1 hypothetical protein XppCFBP6982P_13415 [Xanthomonas phaseoli pv. phaseoli]AZU11524.1 hypothetical protein AC609_02000 [Xanthomonas phaseoli pv. phas
MNSLNTQLGANSSFLQVDPSQNTQTGSNQGNQGISEKQLDQLLTQLIMALLQQSNNADEGQGQGGTSGSGQGGNPQQAGQSNGSPSQYTQMLMNIVGDILQAQNGGGFGGGAGGGFGGGLGVSLASDTGSMQ